jgi:putative transposase
VGLNRSTFRYQQTRRPSDSAVRRILLADVIAEVHAASRGTYGIRRVRAALSYERGLVVNRKLVRKLMAQAGLSGLPGRKKGRRNLRGVATHEDLVNRNFTAASPNGSG